MSALLTLVLVVEHVDTDTGALIRVDRSTDHGWESPEQAVKLWRQSTTFKAYRNGRQYARTPDVTVRVYFEGVAA